MAVKGLNSTINRLKKFGDRVNQETREEIFNSTQKIASEATRNAPLSIQVIPTVKNNGYTGELSTNAGPIAAYVEFGTGMSAAEYVPTLPKEWQDLARSFYINGQGTLKKAPYLYPAYAKEVPVLLKNLKGMLKQEARK